MKTLVKPKEIFYTIKNTWRLSMPTETEKWSNLSEIALHIGVSKNTIRNWIKNESMPAHKVGKLWLFRVSEVDQWIASQNQNHA